MTPTSDLRDGVRTALPLVLPTLALGTSFGLVAEPVMGPVAPVVMSVLTFSGGAQFAALGVLGAGGAVTAAVGAGLLVNARWLPMSLAVTPSLRGSTPRRALETQAIVDASFVLAGRPDGTFDRGLLIGATLPQVTAWVTGTVVGVLSSGSLHGLDSLGLDAVFPAFYVALLAQELRQRRDRRALSTVAVAALVTLALLPWAAPGVPVIAGSAAALVGLRNT